MTMMYPKISSAAGLAELSYQLPHQIRQAAIMLMEADSSSDYFYKLCMDDDQIQLLLIEENANENFTVCHCFSTDQWDRDYAYESLSLSSIQMFCKMAQELKMT
ncbi:hypothetical protein J23TS9_32640 [Paenibacillus sp. J23TS9]|uniref:hypothetical protein n=1 Tax=Paenibacillus sp. J23TS9 TaxID=2807193 RepID=UPI001B297C22|nr:hypothetical protein [Paenibacillus sp. J23TS9]GIP28134.1 hypothetical protein J23TS9_32640 [Paenibacillus sp. J23TS9]